MTSREEIDNSIVEMVSEFTDKYVQSAKQILKKNGVLIPFNGLAVVNLATQMIIIDGQCRNELMRNNGSEEFSVKD